MVAKCGRIASWRVVMQLMVVLVSVAAAHDVCGQSESAGAGPMTPVGQLMQSMFSPDRSPPHKTMGLAQRNFLDMVEQVQSDLEIAVVLDGTESMGDNLESAKQTIGQMMADLSRYRGAEIRYQLVVFRDAGAGAGKEIQFPMNRAQHSFSAEPDDMVRGLQEVAPLSGAPYFPEAIDLGVHAAITELAWSDRPETTRWILLFGDAPPFASGFAEDAHMARRHYATDQLVALATTKGIAINCVLCTSRAQDQAIYQRVLEETRQFMSTLSTETGGLMVDLSYADIQKTLEEAAKKRILRYVPVEPIREAEIEAVRAQLQASQTASPARTTIAILPHLPIPQMTFDPTREEVRVAAELRQKFREVPGTEVKSPAQVKRMFMLLQARSLSDSQLLQTLASGLDVDYVVWGSMKPVNTQQGVVEFQSAVYSRSTGEPVMRSVSVQNNVKATPAKNLTGDLAVSLMKGASQSQSDPLLANRFRLVSRASVQEEVLRPVSVSPGARDEIWTALEALEQSLGYLADEAAGIELNRKAQQAIDRALDPAAGDPRNPFALLLRSNALFNEAQTLVLAGSQEAARERTQGFVLALDTAYRERNRAGKEAQAEIEADYALFRQRDYAQAIRLYQAMTTPAGDEEVRMHSALRAHWMLAGIYAGDWNVPDDVKQFPTARQHLIEILAKWPDSPEARKLRQWLRWDDAAGESKFQQYPLQGEQVINLIES